MPVYVDQPIPCFPTPAWPFLSFCRLWADNITELHEMARKLWLKREWYKANGLPPHYELPGGKRKKAIALGAVDITRKESARQAIAFARRRAGERRAG